MAFRTLDDVDVAGKRVLLRADLNVPVRDGAITDLTRLERLTPTIRELSDRGARVIVADQTVEDGDLRHRAIQQARLRPFQRFLRHPGAVRGDRLLGGNQKLPRTRVLAHRRRRQ